MCLCGSGGGVDGRGGSSGVDGRAGSSSVDGRTGSSGVGGSVVYRSSGGGLFMSILYFRIGWSFFGRGGGNGAGDGVCCEAGL